MRQSYTRLRRLRMHVTIIIDIVADDTGVVWYVAKRFTGWWISIFGCKSNFFIFNAQVF